LRDLVSVLVDAVSEVSLLLSQLSASRELAVGFVVRALTALEGELPAISLGNLALALPDGLAFRPGAAQIMSGSFTRTVTGGRHAPLQFVHSGSAPVTVALHRSGSPTTTTVTVPRNGLLIFPGDVGYSVDAAHTVILVGELDIAPRR